jgi:LmbE family N-acetylglucosaminyl deacetylase
MHLFNRRLSLALVGAAAFCRTLVFGAPAPLAPAAIAQELRSLGTTGTVLHIAAHPDDENTELITYLSRGRGYRTAYLSLTRGDGGQNELGRDFDEKLGVARTQELLAARRLDNGRQFFTRAIDFGFSKTPEETLQFWDRKEVLGDVVRIIREFRPDVIVTRFPIPPGSGGHGHHTASAILAVEAFKLAADPTAYPEQLAQGLTVWQAKRVLWNVFRFGASSSAPLPLNGPTFTQDIAGNDPVTGEAFGAIAGRSRSMHKTQGLGGFASRANTGPNVQTFMTLAGDPASNDLMDGVDTTWARVSGGAEIGPMIEAAAKQFKPDNPAASVPTLLAIRAKLAALPNDALVADKRAQLDHILQSCLGIKVETTIANAEVVPGEKVKLNYRISSTAPVDFAGVSSPVLPDLPRPRPQPMAAAQTLAGEIVGTVPTDTLLTQPYWLREDGAAGISRVSDPSLIGRPENPPAVPIDYSFTVGGQTFVVHDEPVQLVAGASEAQARKPVAIIPPVSLALNSEVYIAAPGATKQVTVEVSAARGSLAGSLQLEAPAGWTIAPSAQPFRLNNVGDKASVTFSVTAPATPGSGWLKASATIGGHVYSNQRYEVRYAHIPIQLLQPPARARIASFALATKGLNIGYLPGAGDYVAECLTQMGYLVRTLSGADLTPEKLKGLDAVVIGVRAFNERDDLKAGLPGLFAWVEQGGTVIAQYNRPNGLQTPELGPYKLSIEGSAPKQRVTDEKAPVSFVSPDARVLNTPNKIGPTDFDGWVQERGAYFPSSWDEAHYETVLSMSDPGEAPLKSSVLIAKYGQGHYVYTGVAFFRQLPAGVPGAYRLFANLVSLGK